MERVGEQLTGTYTHTPQRIRINIEKMHFRADERGRRRQVQLPQVHARVSDTAMP